MLISTDLHGHTLFSDGRATPVEYVNFRRSLGLKVIAVADHDHFAGVRSAWVAAEQAGMLLVPASEITAFWGFGGGDAEQVHVLAYFPWDYVASGRLEHTFLHRRGQRVQAKWKSFVLEWLHALDVDDRLRMDPEGELEKLGAETFPALQPFIDRIVVRHRDLFEPFRKHHVRFWDDDELFGWEPEEAIEAIRGDGGIDIVAHPGRYRDKARLGRLMALASGLEVVTSRHHATVAEHFRDVATHQRKLWTASADDHQNARYVMPSHGSPVATVERLLGRTLPMSMIVTPSWQQVAATPDPGDPDFQVRS